MHQRNLMIAGGVLVAALAIAAAIGASNAARRRQANEELANALTTLRAQNYAQAATQLRTVADSWGSSEVAKIARLLAADAQLEVGNPEVAATDLRIVLADPPPAEYLEQQASLNLGQALESKQDLGGAADNYAKAAGLSGPYRSIALLREARLREQLGDKSRAEELYETYVRDFPQAPEVAIAERGYAGYELPDPLHHNISYQTFRRHREITHFGSQAAFVQAEHQVQILDRYPGRALAEIVEDRHQQNVTGWVPQYV
jgi:outer membrane protein assembly factor BamD (BamD/ComL family)